MQSASTSIHAMAFCTASNRMQRVSARLASSLLCLSSAGWSSRGFKRTGVGDVGEERGQFGRRSGTRPTLPLELQAGPGAQPRAHPTQRRVPDDPPRGRAFSPVAVIVASRSSGALAPTGFEVAEVALGPQVEAMHLGLALVRGA